MSFQNNSIWLPNGSGSVPNGEMCHDASTRIHQKRGHQWFMDSSEQELFLNKKQAVEPVRETSGPAVFENSLWHDGSSFPSEGQTPILYNPKPVQALNVSVDDPLCLNTGHRKVKVNEVRISENGLSKFEENPFRPGEKNKVISTTFQRTGANMFPGPTYSTTGVNNVPMDPAFSKVDRDFVSVGQPSSQRDGNFMLTNPYYNGIGSNVLSVGQVFNSATYNINPVGEQYQKENSNFSLICPTYSRGHENFFGLDPFYSNKVNDTFLSTAPSKGDTNINFGPQQDAPVVPYKDNSSILSMVENSRKGEETTISFGGFRNNVEERDRSGRLISSYDVLLNQSSGQSSGALGQKDSADQLSANVISAASLRADGPHKVKDQKTKKGSSNNFPSNVKSLLSTGILDGVPVKYVSWSREKNLRGVVKGTGYLCSCQDCKLLKAINAYEFERHAGCKTKHPNNHIYFENGKTIYAVVQELKSTPQEMLFDVIQNITGSPVNQKNFDAWKASFQAATRELQRIYGNDDMIAPS